jgi:hypothetical protein
MTIWDTYPADYRAAEAARIRAAARSGDCVSVVGLSGAGKSNLFGWLAHRAPSPPRWALIDCNRLTDHTPGALFRLIRRALTGAAAPADDEVSALDSVLDAAVADGVVALLLDRFDALTPTNAVAGNLRALRDARKFRLSLVFGTRHGMPPAGELAELCHANTFALGCLSATDAAWNVKVYAERKGLNWGPAEAGALTRITGGYPSLLRAGCEALAGGAPLSEAGISAHAAVRARIEEFWSDNPTPEELHRAGLDTLSLLMGGRPAREAQAQGFDATRLMALTAKESALLEYLRAHAGSVCDKDDLIQAVWPEDAIFERGVRDDSLAQLVRRLREKVEADPGKPRHVKTVAGRGYTFRP